MSPTNFKYAIMALKDAILEEEVLMKDETNDVILAEAERISEEYSTAIEILAQLEYPPEVDNGK